MSTPLRHRGISGSLVLKAVKVEYKEVKLLTGGCYRSAVVSVAPKFLVFTLRENLFALYSIKIQNIEQWMEDYCNIYLAISVES